MPDDKSKAPQTVPIADLMKLKSKLEKTEKERDDALAKIPDFESQVRKLSADLKTATLNLQDDDEVKLTRDFLMMENETLEKARKERDEKDKALLVRERGARAKELRMDYKSKGLDLKEEDLLSAENMEDYSKTQHLEFLAKENERLKAKPSNPAESVFDGSEGGVIKKQPKDMTDAEFVTHVQNLQKTALAK